jgi:fermentation-respiration switch protein FrsA (DUF1100 family)
VRVTWRLVIGGLAVCGVLVAGLAGCSASPAVSSGLSPSVSSAVGVITDTFVDTHRTTAAWGPSPAQASRTLVTTVLYPATGNPTRVPKSGAPPNRKAGPFPFIIFGHGLGSSPTDYLSLLTHWATAGYVVAAPLFPLSSSKTPGGPDAGDIVNQPGDMSFVIDSVLDASAASSGTLAGLVNPHEIGAAGHSNGAISTLGLVGNTCCFDPRVDAAVEMAGTTEGFSTGHYVLSQAPPLLAVQGTADQLVPYRSAVLVYNQAKGPKGLVTIHGGSHESAAGQSRASSSVVFRVTTDFFDAYLRHDVTARRRIAGDGSRVVAIHFVSAQGATATLPVPRLPPLRLHASVTPDTGLANGQAVTVRWSGYTPGQVVNILQCSHVQISTADSSGCDFSNALILHPDPTGNGSATLHVASGNVGNGICDVMHNTCSILVNNAGSTDPSATVELPISFAG